MSRAQRDALRASLRQQGPGFTAQPVAQMRAGFAALMAAFPVPEVRTSDTTLGGRPAVAVEPIGPSRPGTVLYLHGGSFVLGSPATAMGLTAGLVARTGMRAVSLDYRLAPEHPFPAGIDDCLAAYRELLDTGVPAEGIALAGDSAGGGLAVATTLAARDAGLPVPAAVVAFSPGLDLTRSGATMTTKTDVDPLLTPDGMRHTGAMYLDGADPLQPLLAPALTGDLTGFPPVLVQVGTDELLLDDSVRFAARARDAEVDVVLDVTAGVPHVFQSFVGTLDESEQALDRAALFLPQHVAAG